MENGEGSMMLVRKGDKGGTDFIDEDRLNDSSLKSV